jgi:protein-disulfide isomerase
MILRTVIMVVITAFMCLSGSGCRKEPAKKDAGKDLLDAGGVRHKPSARLPNLGGEVFKVPLEDSPSSGTKEALVTAVLFADFTNSRSKEYFESLERFRKRHPKEFRWVYKNFPRVPRPEIAMSLARLAVRAQELGKFDAFAENIYGHAKQISQEKLEIIARLAGLDEESVKRALINESYSKRVVADRRLAVRLGVRFAPAVFINGRRYRGTTDQQLEEFFATEKRRATTLLRRGTPVDRIYEHLTRRGKVSAWMQKLSPQKAPLREPTRLADSARDSGQSHEKVFVEPGAGPFLGPKDARVQLVIFADLECSFCSKMISNLRELQRQYPRTLRIFLRQLPALKRKDVQDAEIAVVAAAGHAKQWAFVEKVYANSRDLDRKRLLAWAGELGMGVSGLKKHLERPDRSKAKLEANRAAAKQAGVRGRPHMFVQGRRVAGAAPLSTLKKLIDQALDEGP